MLALSDRQKSVAGLGLLGALAAGVLLWLRFDGSKPLAEDGTSVDVSGRVVVSLDPGEAGDSPPMTPLAIGEDRGVRDEAAGDADAETKGEQATFGEVLVRVLARDGHAPVPGATVWTVPSQTDELVTGSDGAVRFQAEAPALLIGVESAPGYLLWDPRTMEDGAEGEGGSTLLKEVQVSQESTMEVEVFVRLGVTIRGGIVDAAGAPVPHARLALAGASGNDWEPARVHHADESGGFEFQGLAPNWYLVGPDPWGDDVFPFERIRADWGSTHEVTLQLLPVHDVAIELIPAGIGDADPWPFRVKVSAIRQDRMKVPSRRDRRSWPRHELPVTLGDDVEPGLRGPQALQFKLCEGPHSLSVSAAEGPGPEWPWIRLQPWNRQYPFRVDRVGQCHFDEPGGQGRAVLTGMDEVALLDATITGANSKIYVRAEGTLPDHLFLVQSPDKDANGAMFIRGAIDLGRFDFQKLHFFEKVRGEPNRFIRSLDIQPGLNEVSLQCFGAGDNEN